MWKLGQNREKNWFGDWCTFLVAEETQVQLPGFWGVTSAGHTGQQPAGLAHGPGLLSIQQDPASPRVGVEMDLGVCSSPEVFGTD